MYRSTALKALALALCAVLVLAAMASCAGGNDPSPKVILDPATKLNVTERMYSYWLSYYKTQMLQNYGLSGDVPEIWDYEVGKNEAGEPMKLKDALMANVQDSIKHVLAASVAYKNYGQKLAASDSDDIKNQLKEMESQMGGSSAFNAELSKYNSDKTVLEKVLVLEQTYQALTDYLFNDTTGTIQVGQPEIEKYFDEHKDEFVFVQHILIDTNLPDDSTDETEDASEETTTSSAQDAIDNLAGIEPDTTSPEVPATTEDGEPSADAKQKQAEKIALAADIESKLKSGTPYEELKDYSEDPGLASFPEGYVFTRGEMVAEFEDAAFAMAVGDVRSVVTNYGTHIIKKIELTKDSFVKWYSDVAKNKIQMAEFDAILAPIIAGFEINDEIMNSYNMASIAAMFNEQQ